MQEIYIPAIENINAPKVVKMRKIFFGIWIAVILIYAAFALIEYNYPLGINEDFLYYVRLVINPGNLLFWGLWLGLDHFFISKRTPFIKFDGEIFSIRKNAVQKFSRSRSVTLRIFVCKLLRLLFRMSTIGLMNLHLENTVILRSRK